MIIVMSGKSTDMRSKVIVSALIYALVSCTQAGIQESLPSQEKESPRIIATISNGSPTKTSLSPDDEGTTRAVLWTQGDRIVVASADAPAGYVFATEADGEMSAEFAPEEEGVSIDYSKGILAAYPAGKATMDGADEENSIALKIPAEQKYTADSFEEGAMPMVSGVSFDENLKFKNAAGILRLLMHTDYIGVKVSSIEVKADQILASGEEDAGLSYSPSTLEYDFDASAGVNTLTVDCGEGVHIDSDGTPFHLVVPHQTYTGMVITVNTTDGNSQVYTMQEDKSIAVQRSVISTVPLEFTSSTAPKVTIEQKSSTYNDIVVSISMSGFSKYYCGIMTKDFFVKQMATGGFAETASCSPNVYDCTGSKLNYAGSAFSFQSEIKENTFVVPGQTYVMWVVPYKTNKDYTDEDVAFAEISTEPLKPGATQNVTYSGLTVDESVMSVTLTAYGAAMIYSCVMDADAMSGFDSDDEIIEHLISPAGQAALIEGASGSYEIRSLSPGKDYTLFAIPVNNKGQYGKLLKVSFTTVQLPYNDLIVNINKVINKDASGNVIVDWTVTGGTAKSFRYVFTATNVNRWLSTIGGTVENAQIKMFKEPNLYWICKTEMSSVSLGKLTKGQEYVLVVVAVDSSGNSSVADSWFFVYDN